MEEKTLVCVVCGVDDAENGCEVGPSMDRLGLCCVHAPRVLVRLDEAGVLPLDRLKRAIVLVIEEHESEGLADAGKV